MDKLKGAVGMGGKDQEGQEPVSGAQGEGNTVEPFDAGNKQDATHGEPTSELGSDHAYLSSAIDADSARAAEESKSDQPTAAATGEATKETDTSKDGEEDHEEKKKKGGGFFKSLGFGGSKKKEEEEAQAGAEKAEQEKAEKEKHLPPNHLGSAVPEGASTDLADPGTVAPGQTDGLAASNAPTTTSPTTTAAAGDAAERSGSTSKQPTADRNTSVGSASSPRSGSSAQQPANLMGSRGEHRGSMIPADAPKYKRVENPDRIPIAGGKRIGEEQYQTRRASVAPPSSPSREMPKLDREGSPDPVTADNTQSNTKPQLGGNTAPKEMKEFSMGDASKEAEAKPISPGATEDVAPDEGGPGAPSASSVGDQTTNSGSGSALKEKMSPSSGGGGHARRGSVFDKLKEKMKGSKGK